MEVLQDLGRQLVFPIDFESQSYTESISNKALYLITFFSFISGYLTESIKVSGIVFVLGLIVVLVIVLPPYSAYNKHRPQWANSGPTVVEPK
ncbi:signal peptidase complex subunit SPC1 [Kluyveromyces lactis]|uniref:Signal peptidase complex subunit 1 n=1 Tax=Kluyveromyces lactis (strain ATCC 8585 / CBS 2359 / DSM 70799 / NBRC 1267 / NRRL Y-1140 / WM37) TaxID=284590 RepID=Q6CNV0_KLULA|nr:uncharacterized protein KLLA0_E09747g [Kluyveromyces lactis]CAG99476.1 KLLA0E09747p [Kluyveromyces lactis]|eukprot:XP_454389.1 uncharacterized protein KLLA0_E09747g [Kluyveromyces lactis]